MARWALISDEHSSSRSACALEVATRLRRLGVAVGGFVQQRVHETAERPGFELVRLNGSGARLSLADRGLTAPGEAERFFCDYVFKEEAFAQAKTWLEEDARACQLLVVDAISKMESYGKGHGPALRMALGLPDDRVVLVCGRSCRIQEILAEFHLDVETIVAWLELPVAGDELDRFVDALATACRPSGPVGGPRAPER